MQLSRVVGVDSVPSCLDNAVQSGLLLSSEEARKIVIAILLYFKEHEINQQTARRLISEWQNEQHETLIGRGVGDLSDILMDNEIQRIYSKKKNLPVILPGDASTSASRDSVSPMYAYIWIL
jgi:hypothetical protein